MKKARKRARSLILPLAIFAASLSPSAFPIGTIANAAETAFNEVAQEATPAVVSISVIKREEQGRSIPGLAFPPNDATDQRSMGIGTGVLIRKDGYILTNHHVIENAEKITVKFDEKHKFVARAVGTDPDSDLAVIKIKEDTETAGYPTLAFGDSTRVKVGDWAIAIGSPFGLNRSISKGVVSAMGRAQIGILDVEDFIQTDAAINPGSSGGPLLNMNGEIIGINTAIFSQGAGFVGIGFAIPAEIARDVAAQLIAHGRVRRGWLGVSVQDLDEDLARYFKAPGTKGALVRDVLPRSPADQASLRPGDIILRYNGKPVLNASEFKKSYSQGQTGSIASTEILRDGSKHQLKLTLSERPHPSLTATSAAVNQQAGKRPSKPRSLGLTIEEIPAEIAALLKMKNTQGVLIVGVEPGSPAFEAGLSPGDIVLRANGKEVHTTQEFARLSPALLNRDLSMLYVQRGPEDKLFVPLKMDT